MKSIFTKLSTLLLCGAVALVSCTDFSADLKYVDEKVDALAAKTEKEIQDLAASVAETYATKAELAGVEGQLKDLKASVEALQGLLDSKADKATVEAAVADLEAKIAAIKGCTCEPSEPCTCEPTDLTAVNEAIAKLEAAIAAIKGCTCEPSEPCTCEPVDLTAIDEALAAIESQLEATEKALEEIKGALAEIDPAFAEVNAAIAAAMELAEAAATAEDVEAAFAELEAVLADEIAAVKAELGEAIADFAGEYEALNEKLAELEAALEALAGQVENLATELRGIVMVPQILVSGTPAVEFLSFVYVPMTEADEYVSAEGAEAEAVVVGDPKTVAYFHFNPSNFDVESATYSVVSTTVETRAAAEPVATVGKVVKEGDVVKAELLRGKGADNMFAFAATLENGAVITSDYALVLDARTNADALVIVNVNDEPLYTTLAEAEENDPALYLESTEPFNFADYVKAIDPVYAAFGVEYKYSLVYTNNQEKVKVAEDGTAKLKWADGVQIVKVEAMHGENVVRRAYVKVYVNFTEPEMPGIYYTADAVATVQAERIAFEVKDILVWAKALKDEPNTVEILKEVKAIVENIAEIAQSDEVNLQKNYLIEQEVAKAYELLNGVPGFVKKYATYTGTGFAKARVEFLPEITNLSELKAVIEMLEEQYTADFTSQLTESIISFVPESLKNNFLISAILSRLENFQVSDLLENETVLNLLETAQSLAKDYLGIDILDFTAINDMLDEVLKDYVGENKYGEEAAKLGVQAKARAAAETEMKAAVDAANEQLMANFDNGVWGKLYNFINVDLNIEENEIIAQLLEQYGLTETVVALEEMVESVIDYGADLVKYTYEGDDITYDVTVERYEVLEDEE